MLFCQRHRLLRLVRTEIIRNIRFSQLQCLHSLRMTYRVKEVKQWTVFALLCPLVSPVFLLPLHNQLFPVQPLVIIPKIHLSPLAPSYCLKMFNRVLWEWQLMKDVLLHPPLPLLSSFLAPQTLRTQVTPQDRSKSLFFSFNNQLNSLNIKVHELPSIHI